MSQPSITQSPSGDKGKPTKIPTKLGKNLKKIKRQVSRVFHHVSSPKHHDVASGTLAVLTTTTAPLSNIIHIFPPSPPRHPSSPKTAYRRDSLSKSDYADHSDRTSSDESIIFTEVSSRSSIMSTSDMSVEESQISKISAHESSISPPPALGSEVKDSSSSVPSSSEPMFSSPPNVYVEPEVPDPFLIDDEDDSSEEEGRNSPSAPISSSQQTITPSHEISLAIPTSPSISQPTTPHTIPLPPSDLNKDVPPPPSSDSEPDEDEAPDLYLPGLVIPTMFLPIPNVRRPFSSHYLMWWLSRSLMYYTCTRRIH